MQLEVDLTLRVVRCLLEVLRDDLLDLAALGGDADRVPDAQQHGLDPAGHPVTLGTRVLDRDQHIGHRNDSSFGDCTDAQRQETVVIIDHMHPTLEVEWLTVNGEEFLCFTQVAVGDPLGQVLLQVVLQAEHDGLGTAATAALDVREDAGGVRRVLEPVTGLVRISV